MLRKAVRLPSGRRATTTGKSAMSRATYEPGCCTSEAAHIMSHSFDQTE